MAAEAVPEADPVREEWAADPAGIIPAVWAAGLLWADTGHHPLPGQDPDPGAEAGADTMVTEAAWAAWCLWSAAHC